MGEVNQFKWVGVRPVEPVEHIYVSQAQKTIQDVTQSDTTVGAGTTVTWLSVSGRGEFIFLKLHSWNTGWADMAHETVIDGVNTGGDILVSPFEAGYGYYCTGNPCNYSRIAYGCAIWDTSNNIYRVITLCNGITFKTGFELRYHNRGSGTIHFWARFMYYLETSSREIDLPCRLKKLGFKEVCEIRKMLRKEFRHCDAVIFMPEPIEFDYKKLKQKQKRILRIVMHDKVIERNKDKIINRLAKEKMICL